jgi:hypothetical protein
MAINVAETRERTVFMGRIIEDFCLRRLHSQPPQGETWARGALSRASGREAAREARP